MLTAEPETAPLALLAAGTWLSTDCTGADCNEGLLKLPFRMGGSLDPCAVEPGAAMRVPVGRFVPEFLSSTEPIVGRDRFPAIAGRCAGAGARNPDVCIRSDD